MCSAKLLFKSKGKIKIFSDPPFPPKKEKKNNNKRLTKFLKCIYFRKKQKIYQMGSQRCKMIRAQEPLFTVHPVKVPWLHRRICCLDFGVRSMTHHQPTFSLESEQGIQVLPPFQRVQAHDVPEKGNEARKNVKTCDAMHYQGAIRKRAAQVELPLEILQEKSMPRCVVPIEGHFYLLGACHLLLPTGQVYLGQKSLPCTFG